MARANIRNATSDMELERDRREREGVEPIMSMKALGHSEEYDRCTCCYTRVIPRYTLSIGRNNHATSMVLCSACLSKLGEMIWELDEDGESW